MSPDLAKAGELSRVWESRAKPGMGLRSVVTVWISLNLAHYVTNIIQGKRCQEKGEFGESNARTACSLYAELNGGV